MARAVGIGGYFLRARNPKDMAVWYETHLGLPAQPPWMQGAGPTVFAMFPPDDDYFPQDVTAMLNLRFDDLPGLIAKLQSAGIEVETRSEWDSEIGVFARIHDPEGNPIELWEPSGLAAK